MKMLIALLLVPIGAMAQSESVTRQLLNQPTSLLDVGMVRLQMLTGESVALADMHNAPLLAAVFGICALQVFGEEVQ